MDELRSKNSGEPYSAREQQAEIRVPGLQTSHLAHRLVGRRNRHCQPVIQPSSAE
jgi:hypothetical protein